MFTRSIKHFITDESGQGLTEYGAILAFVALLIAIVVTLGSGSLKNGLSSTFSLVASQISAIVASAS